jgi:hypothetical protein
MMKPAIKTAIAMMSSVLRARRFRFLLATSSHAGKNPPPPHHVRFFESVYRSAEQNRTSPAQYQDRRREFISAVRAIVPIQSYLLRAAA